MATRAILTIATHDKYLRRRQPSVTRFHGQGRTNVEQTQRDLTDTLLSTSSGVGLAAPQIGISLRAIAYRAISGQVNVLFNPKIIRRSKNTTVDNEMCLSIPGFIAKDVERAQYIAVEAQNARGTRMTVEFSGYAARVIQHEIDHLDGKLISDIVSVERVVQTNYVGEVGAIGAIDTETSGAA